MAEVVALPPVGSDHCPLVLNRNANFSRQVKNVTAALIRWSRRKFTNGQQKIVFRNSHSLWQKIWSMKTVPKLRTFLWSVCQNALATRDNLFHRKIVLDPFCPLCRQSDHSPDLEVVASIFWQIWRNRNHFIFRN